MKGTQRSVKIVLNDNLEFTVTCPFCGKVIIFDQDDHGAIKYWESKNHCPHFMGVYGVGYEACALFQGVRPFQTKYA